MQSQHGASVFRHLMSAAAIAVACCLGLGPPASAQQVTSPEDGIPSWTIHFGGFQQLRDVSALSADEAWGIDPLQTSVAPGRRPQTAFVHWHDGVWRTAQVADGVALQALELLGPRHGLAVGLDGAIWRFNGQRWNPDVSPTDISLTDLSIVASDPRFAWAVGERATILRLVDGLWSHEPVPAPLGPTRIHAVAAVSTEEAWAVTQSGRILRRDASGWHVAEDAPLTGALLDVSFNGTDHVLFVGAAFVEWHAGTWRVVEGGSSAYAAVQWRGEDAIVIGDGLIHRYAAGSMTQLPIVDAPDGVDTGSFRFFRLAPMPGGKVLAMAPNAVIAEVGAQARYHWPPSPRLLTVDAVAEGSGWAGGVARSAGMIGGDLVGAWTTLSAMPSGTVVTDIDLVGPNDGWAVGHYEPPRDPEGIEGRLWRLVDGAWREQPFNKLWRMRRIQMLDADEGWASGDNIVVRWNGEAWSQVATAPAAATVGDLAIVRGGEEPLGFFGGRGAVYRMTGEEWFEWSLAVAELVTAVVAPAEDEAWALTDSELFRYDGSTWRAESVPVQSGSRLVDLSATDRGSLWLLTDPPALHQLTDGKWHYHDLRPLGRHSTPFRLHALRLEPDSFTTDVWLAGEPPMVARYHLSEVESSVALPWLGR